MEKIESNIKYPRYISNKPCGQDMFKNKPHESIATAINDLICNSDSIELKNPVIGLDGDWGSGKSNLINILEKKLEKEKGKYYVFTYDVWGHQEDLTRLSFLEEIIEWLLLQRNGLKNKKKWLEKEKKISAKFKKSNRTVFPKIKLMYFWLALIPFSNMVINILSETVVNPSALITYSQLKLIVTIVFTLFSIISLVLNIITIFKNLIAESNKAMDSFSLIEKISFVKEAFSSSLYFFTGKEIETKIDEYILEDEPSVKRFNNIFNEFIEDIDGDGLIVVFDNMDRLSNKEKLMSIWSSIHTFFAEVKSDFKVWTIIPYDKYNLSKLLDDKDKQLVNEFINKTFFLTIRIPNAIYDNWKEYFCNLINQAFNEKTFNNNQIDVILSLFSTKNEGKISPRTIVSFINDIVTLSIIKTEIEIEYIALYSLEKDSIIENYSTMINFQYLEKYLIFFNNKEVLTKNLAAIYYNIDRESAKSILYEQKIEEELNHISVEFKESIRNESFWNWFQKTITGENLSKYNFSNLVLIYNEISTIYPDVSFNRMFSIKILDSIKEEDIYIEAYDKYIEELSPDKAVIFFTKIITNQTKIEKLDNYCKIMDKLFYYDLDEKQKNDIKTIPLKVSSEVYIKKYNEYKKRDLRCFTNLKLEVDDDSLIKYFFENNLYKASTTDDIEVIQYLSSRSKQLPQFKAINDSIVPNLHTLPENIINIVLKVNRWLNPRDMMINIANAVNIFDRYKALNVFSKEKSDIICALLKQLNSTDISSNITEILSMTEVSKETIEIIQNYVSFNDLFQLLVKYKSSIVKLIISELIRQNIGKKLDSKYIFSNIKTISVILDEEVLYKFFEIFEGWEEYWPENLIEECANVNDWFEFVNKENIQKYKVIKYVYDKVHNKLKILEKDEWIKSLSESDSNFMSLKNLCEKELIDIEILNRKHLYDSIKELFINYIEGSLNIDTDFYIMLIKKISDTIMNQIVLEVFQKANSLNPASFSPDKTLFILKCILNFKAKIKDYDSLIDNYLKKAIDESSNILNDILSESQNANYLGKVVNNYKQDKTFLIDSLDAAKQHEHIKAFIENNKLEKVLETVPEETIDG